MSKRSSTFQNEGRVTKKSKQHEPEVRQAQVLEKVDVSAAKISELRIKCKERNLPSKGKKGTLVKSLDKWNDENYPFQPTFDDTNEQEEEFQEQERTRNIFQEGFSSPSSVAMDDDENRQSQVNDENHNAVWYKSFETVSILKDQEKASKNVRFLISTELSECEHHNMLFLMLEGCFFFYEVMQNFQDSDKKKVSLRSIESYATGSAATCEQEYLIPNQMQVFVLGDTAIKYYKDNMAHIQVDWSTIEKFQANHTSPSHNLTMDDAGPFLGSYQSVVSIDYADDSTGLNKLIKLIDENSTHAKKSITLQSKNVTQAMA
jgi:hypothetical protein